MRGRHDEEYTVIEPTYSMSYTIDPHGSYHTAPQRKFFSRVELKNISLAVAALVVAFTLVRWDREIDSLPFCLGLSALVVLLGFFSHEMAHKVVARRYGCWAEFRAYMRGLGLALLMSFFGFLFAAPGAVYIIGRISREQNGWISVAGPASNLAIAAACLPFAGIYDLGMPDEVVVIASSLLFFNSFLAAFNMVPFPPLDGSKVWAWNKPIYVVTLAAAALLLIIAMMTAITSA